MPLQLKTIPQFVQDSITIINELLSTAAGFAVKVPTSSGGIFLTLMFAAASQSAFLLAQCQYVVNFARFSTSEGPDCDSWGAQFGFKRLPGSAAYGDVILTIPAAQSVNLVVPSGVQIQTPDGTIVYELIPDTKQNAWDAIQEGYILPSGQTQITATAQAILVGSPQNVQPSTLTQFASPSFGIQGVSNPSVIENGTDPESDASYRARFVLFINNLSLATQGAIELAVEDSFAGNYSLLENLNPSLMTVLGYFTVVLNNPGETVTADQITAVFNAVLAARAFTIQAAVIAATVEPVTIFLDARINPNFVGVTEAANIGGTVSPGDVLTIHIDNSGLPGGTQAINYTVVMDDTLTSIAAGLAAVVNANTYCTAQGITATSVGNVVTIAAQSANLTTYTSSLSGGATETITLTATGTVENAIQNAIIQFVNYLPIGATLYLSDLMQVAMNASPYVQAIEYSSLTINGEQADYTVTAVQVPQTSLTQVSVGRF